MSNNFPNTVGIDQGRDLVFSVIWKDSTGALVNLTGYSAAFAVAEDYGLTPVISITQASGITLGGASGSVSVSVSAALTENLTKSVYVGELVLVSGSGVETSLLKGSIKCSSKVVP